MSRGTEETFLLGCLRVPRAKGGGAAQPAAPPGMDWRRALRLAAEQAVLGLVLARIEPHRLPGSVRTEADATRRVLASASLHLTATLLELLGRFGERNVPVLPFKGPTLAVQAYGDVGLRAFADLDLLVRPPDLDAARELLLSIGFTPSYAITPARRRLLQRQGSHESFERTDGALVELHWRVAAPVSEFRIDYDRLWARAGTVRLAGQDVPALPPDDLLLVLALHGAKHAWERLGWICDVAMLVAAEPGLDWDGLMGEADRMAARRIVLLAVRLAARLDAPIPPRLARMAASDPAVARLAAHVEDRLFEPPRSGAGTLAFHLGTRIGWRDKTALLLGGLTALNQRDLELLSLPGPAAPLYFLTRPVRLAGKTIAHALGRRAR